MRSTKVFTRIAGAALIATLASGGMLVATSAGAAGAATAAAVAPATTTITLRSTNANANYGAAGKIVATVKRVAPAKGVPTGTVDFSVDGGWISTETLDATGKAALPLTFLYPSYFPGTYAITASYSGDADNNPSVTATSIPQTLVGISTQPTTTITLNAKGRPVFTPRSFTMSSWNPVGCNVTIFNNTPNTLLLAYGTPGAWKRLPFGAIAPGTSRGVGVGMANYTGYFTTTANLSNYVAIHCV